MFNKTSLFITILFAICVNGLYFHIGETEKKCFIEEMPEDTLLVGEYKVEIFDKEQQKFVPTISGLGMHVELMDPDGSVLMSRAYADRGQFSATSHLAGEHTLCLHSNSTARWFNTGHLRVHLDLRIGEHAQDYAAIAAKEKLNDLQLRLRQLLDQVDQISKEQNYQRLRESVFRNLSEQTNSRVLWWSVLQTGLLVGTGFWQMRHLKSFFQAKKLV